MLRTMVRLLISTLLAAAGCGAVLSSPAAAGESPNGIDYGTLMAICDRYQGRFVDGELPNPYSYGCVFVDGEADCLETTECSFFRLDDRQLPFEESCARGGGEFKVVDPRNLLCSNAYLGVLLTCDESLDNCLMASEQPMPLREP